MRLGERTPLQPLHGDVQESWKPKQSIWNWLGFGPGLLVCLADTDFGCLIVAAQSGARWGYSLLLLQVVLIPVLFVTQELTIRLGVYTQEGHTACIKKHFGPGWAWFACILLVFECVCAMTSEMSGIAAVGEIWGLSRALATLLSAVVIVSVVFFCSYRQVEVVGITLGLFELTFVATMFIYHPNPAEVFSGALSGNTSPEYFELIAANMGAVIMPWMIYFQQSAVVARGLTTREDLDEERKHTLMGSILTQLVMIGTLVTLAAASRGRNLENVNDIVSALEPALGLTVAKTLVSLAFVGGSLCAAFVVALAAAWAVSEAVGINDQHSLDKPPSQAPLFYGCFVSVIALGAIVLLMGVNEVKLNIFVELLSGLLLPFAVGFLYFLATGDALPPEVRVTGCLKGALAMIFSLCTVLSLVSGVYGIVA